jgi:hypothetical protein
MSNSERQFPVSRPKMVICRPPEDMVSSDDDDEEVSGQLCAYR